MTAGAVTPKAVATIDEIRAGFPALERRHRGHPVAYLDGPGGTQVASAVVDRMAEYLYGHNANTHWRYPTSEETDELLAHARQVFADFVNGSPEEIAFGLNMTTITFHVARGLGQRWSAGDEIVVTELDHHANVAPWRALERERGVRVQTARLRVEDGSLDLDDLERKVGKRTRLIAIGAASNALGTIVDVPRVARLARAHDALLYVDAVHYAPHELPDVRAMDADFLACSAYKFYGPHVGVIWGRRQLIEQLAVPKLIPAPDTAPERLETGTQNHEGMVGAAGAVEYLASLARGEMPRRQALETTYRELHRRGSTLFTRLWSALGEMKGVTRYGLPPTAPRTPTLALRIKGVTPDDAAVALAERGLFVSHGDFYAATVIERLGVGPDGVVRIGCSAYTSADEIERVIRAIGELASR